MSSKNGLKAKRAAERARREEEEGRRVVKYVTLGLIVIFVLGLLYYNLA